MIVPRALSRTFALVLLAGTVSACATSPGARVRELEYALSVRTDSLTAQVARNDSLQARVDALEAEIERITGLLRTGAATRP
jgi:cell division protein FtsB